MREALLSVLPLFISGLVVNLVMSLITPRLQRREKADDVKATERREVRIDKVIAVFYRIGIIFLTLVAIVFMIPQVVEAMNADYITMLIIVGIGILVTYLSTWMMLKRVEYNDEYFEYVNAVGIRKRFAYTEVVAIKRTLGVIRVSTTGKSFVIFKSFAGHAAFVAFVKEKNPNVTVIV